MTLSAIICLLIVWSIIIGATGYCFKKLMASQRDFGGSDE